MIFCLFVLGVWGQILDVIETLCHRHFLFFWGELFVNRASAELGCWLIKLTNYKSCIVGDDSHHDQCEDN